MNENTHTHTKTHYIFSSDFKNDALTIVCVCTQIMTLTRKKKDVHRMVIKINNNKKQRKTNNNNNIAE